MLDKLPITIKDFKGVNVPDAGQQSSIVYPNTAFDNTPSLEEASSATNIRYLRSGGFKTREGYKRYLKVDDLPVFGVNEILTGQWQIRELKGAFISDRWLFLTWDGFNGRIYDSNAGALALILTLSNMKYAYIINAFGRMYISPWSGWGIPLSNEGVYVWNGDYAPRLAQIVPIDRTAAPATAVANSATAGNITIGTHLFDVVYETDTGFISFPQGALAATPGGPISLQPLSLVCNGNQVTVSNIKVGAAGSGVVKRHILMSKLVVNYDNTGWMGYEPFFAYTINDNTTTSVTFDKPDAGLVESAAYLLDNNEGVIRSCVSMSVLGSRMCYYGPDPRSGASLVQEAIHSVLVSPPGDPERVSTYNLDNSRILVGRDFYGRVNCGASMRGINYAFKSIATFSFTEDNSKDPAEWPVNIIDAGIGANPTGIGRIGAGNSNCFEDFILVANGRGVFVFTGSYSSIPITFGWWGLENPTLLNFTQVFIDPTNKLIYVVFGDPNLSFLDARCSFYWVGDYSRGLDYDSIRWSKDILEISLSANNSASFVTPNLASGRFGLIEYRIVPLIGGRFEQVASYRPYFCDIVLGTPGRFVVQAGDVGVVDPFGLIEAPFSSGIVTGYTPNEMRDLLSFVFLRLRALGKKLSGADGSMDLSYYTLDSSTPISIISNRVIGVADGKAVSEGFNSVGDKIAIGISATPGTNTIAVREYNSIMVHDITLFGAERGKDRAR